MKVALCGICKQPMSGSARVDLSDTGMVTGVYMVHLIDEHWELVEMIHDTRNDPEARTRLNFLLGG